VLGYLFKFEHVCSHFYTVLCIMPLCALIIGAVGTVAWLSTAYVFHDSICVNIQDNNSQQSFYPSAEIIHQADAEVVHKRSPVIMFSAEELDIKASVPYISEEEEEEIKHDKVAVHAMELESDKTNVLVMPVLYKRRQQLDQHRSVQTQGSSSLYF
jgi:hypothetical protein